MPELRLFPIQDAVENDVLQQIAASLEELGIPEVPTAEDSIELDDMLGEDQLTGFLDRLDAHEIACDIYLPLEFEGVFEAGGLAIGSSHALAEALEELRDELDVDSDVEEEMDEGEMNLDLIDGQLNHAWHVFSRGAHTSIARSVPLHVIH